MVSIKLKLTLEIMNYVHSSFHFKVYYAFDSDTVFNDAHFTRWDSFNPSATIISKRMIMSIMVMCHTLFTSSFFTSVFFPQVQPYNRKYRSIGHHVWSNILTELSVN